MAITLQLRAAGALIRALNAGAMQETEGYGLQPVHHSSSQSEWALALEGGAKDLNSLGG
jgi:hypothetical protein